MVHKLTRLNIVDNSGARSALCIGILHKRLIQASIGDELVVSIRTIVSNKHIVRGEIQLALLIRQKKWICRSTGIQVSFKRNAIVLIQPKDKSLIGSRIKGPVTQELRKKRYLRVVCLSTSII